MFNLNFKSYIFNASIKEEVSLELFGKIDTECLRSILPNNVQPLNEKGKTPIYLQIGHVESIHVKKWQLNTLCFDRALWHVGVEYKHQHGFYIFHLDTDNSFIRYLGNFFLKKSMNKASFSFFEKRKSLITRMFPSCGGQLKCHVELGKEYNHYQQIPKSFIDRKDGIHPLTIDNNVDFCRSSVVDIVCDEVSNRLFGKSVEWDENCLVSRGKLFRWEDQFEKN